jgi:hypothetical protein
MNADRASNFFHLFEKDKWQLVTGIRDEGDGLSLFE